MKQPKILRIVIASPSDVPSERDVLESVTAELNGGIAADRQLRMEVVRWETDACPGFHPEGPQALIDPILRIEDCDLLIGIFWKRFGTPTADGRTGTEHEFHTAYQAWKRSGRPEIMVYFNQRAYTPRSKAEAEQWGRVLEFQQNFSSEGLWWPYNGKTEFERLVRGHLTRFIRQRFPLSGLPTAVLVAEPEPIATPALGPDAQWETPLPRLAPGPAWKRREFLALGALLASGGLYLGDRYLRERPNPEAVRLYKEGRFWWNKRARKWLRKSEECFRQASQIDPKYAGAHAGLADCSSTLGYYGYQYYGYQRPWDAYVEAENIAEKAVALDGRSAEAYTARAWARMLQRRWQDAEKDFQSALDCEGEEGYAQLHQWYSFFLLVTRRWKESLEQIERMEQIDPGSRKSRGHRLHFMGESEKAIDWHKKAQTKDRDYFVTHHELGLALEQRARLLRERGLAQGARDSMTGAIQEFQVAVDQGYGGPSPLTVASLGHAYAVSGRTKSAVQVLDKLTQQRLLWTQRRGSYVPLDALAIIHLGLYDYDPKGQAWRRDAALRRLRESVDEGSSQLLLLGLDPRFKSVRGDKRFVEVLDKVGLSR